MVSRVFFLPLPAQFHLYSSMHVDQPVNVALRLVVAILHQHPRILELGAVQPLPGEREAGCFTSANRRNVLQ